MPMEKRNHAMLALLLLGVAAFVPYIMGDGMSLDQLRLEFEHRKMKTLPCYYDGSHCDLELQYCSTTTRTCMDFLNKTDGNLMNINKCKDLLTEDVTELGKYDVCIYFLGSLDKNTIQGGGVTMEQLRVQFENRTSMQIPCIYNGQQCSLASQFCNKTSKRCQDLFPKEASWQQKVEKCKNILKMDDSDPGPYDVCIYYFGKLKHEEGPGESNSSTETTLVVTLAIVFVVLVAVVVFGILYYLHSKKKLPCLKYEQPSDRDTAVAKENTDKRLVEDENRQHEMEERE